jgi:hypothetical protein
MPTGARACAGNDADCRYRGQDRAWRVQDIPRHLLGDASQSRQTQDDDCPRAAGLSVAKDHGKISVNVCEKGGRLYDSDRADIIWLADDIREFCALASVELQAAMLLVRWTGQRQGDLLKLSWKNYDGHTPRSGRPRPARRIG